MMENWYWEHGRQLLGPLDTSTLEDLIRHHRVFDQDRIRLAASDEWMTGAAVKHLFAGQRCEVSAEVASRLLDQEAHRRLNLDATSNISTAATAGRSWLRRIGLHGDRLLGFIADGITGICLAVALIFRSRVARATVAAAAVVGLFGWMNLRMQANQRVYARLQAAAQAVRELQALPPQQFERQSWRRLQTETRAWLAPTLRTLESTAAQHPVGTSSWLESRSAASARRYLIQAARDLDCMVSTVPAPNGCSLHFIVAMEQAQRELSGLAVAGDSQAAPGRSAAAVHLLTMPVITADVLLLAGGLYYWFRRREMPNGREAS